MELDEAYKKLRERQREVEKKLAELTALADEVATAQHQFRRVEAEKFEDLNQALEAALEDYAHARRRFGEALQGE